MKKISNQLAGISVLLLLGLLASCSSSPEVTEEQAAPPLEPAACTSCETMQTIWTQTRSGNIAAAKRGSAAFLKRLPLSDEHYVKARSVNDLVDGILAMEQGDGPSALRLFRGIPDSEVRASVARVSNGMGLGTAK